MESSFSSFPTPTELDPPSPQRPDNKAKKPRHRHTPYQLQKLNELYEKNDHPPLQDRVALAELLGMQTKTLNAWFQNKRASAKKRSNKVSEPAPAPVRHISTLPSTPSSSANSPVQPSIDELPEEEYLTAEYQALLQETPADSPEHQRLLNEILSNKKIMSHKRRMRPNGSQSQQLKEFFNVNPHPSKEERQELGNAIGMSYQSITNWFQNQRSLIKRRKEEDVITSSSSRSRTFSAFPPASGHPSLPSLKSEQSNAVLPASGKPRSARVQTGAKATPSRPRRSRPEPHQLDALKDLYSRTSNPTIDERTALAHEVGLDLGKVTNWFRNLRQTTRKRAKRNSELGEDDQDDVSIYSGYPPSTSVSRDGSPLHSSAASTINDVLMDDIRDEMDIDIEYQRRRLINPELQSRDHSDDEEFRWEAVTPSPSPPPTTNPSKHSLTFTIDPILYAEMEKETAKYSTGVRVEDALLLLGFHHHAFVHQPPC